jgi:F-type H+-transporting ATPase subunit delta
MIGSERILAGRYAAALLRVCEESFTPEVLKSLEDAAGFFKEHKQALFLLELPDFPRAEKHRIMQKLFAIMQLPACFEDVVLLLGEHHRLSLVGDIFRLVLEQYQEHHAIMPVQITSAVALQDKQLQAVQAFLAQKTGKHILYTQHIDKTLIDGIRAQSRDVLWEYSVRKKLREMRLSVIR